MRYSITPRRTILVVAILGPLLGAVYFLIAGLPKPAKCDFERVYGSPHYQIPETKWVLDLWEAGCGFGINSGLQLRAENGVTKVSKTLLWFLDNTSNVTVSSDRPKSLIITMPNRSDFDEVDTHLDGVKITYRFLLEDDPEDRENYQRWNRHSDDPVARDWYCRNILAKMDKTNRDSWNRIIGGSFPIKGDTSGLYCPDLR